MFEFRPHHFLCTVGFEGKGYSPEFVAGYQKIAETLRSGEGDQVLLQVVERTDSICAPCPSKRSEHCLSQEKIEKLDRAHAEVLGLKKGEVLSWGDAKERIRSRMTEEAFESACEPCSWKSLGMCREALRKLKGIAPLLLILLGTFAQAATEPPATKSIDLLEARIKKAFKSKKAHALSVAYTAYDKDHYAEAIAAAKPVLHDALFSDYALWITAISERALAADQIESGQAAAALKGCNDSISKIFQIETRNPYSPFVRSAHKEIGLTELVLGDALWKSGQLKPAELAYERAFQRLLLVNGWNAIEPDSLSHYSESCKKAPSELCRAWIPKLASWYSSGSAESKAILASFPEAAERFPSHNPGKATMAYRSPDLDQTAFENAMKQYFDNKYRPAIKSFRQFQDDFPRSTHRYRARYWQAQALTHEQDHEASQKMYDELQKDSPLSYYGLLASITTGKNLDAPIDTKLPQGSEDDPAMNAQETYHLKRARQLLAERAPVLASMELREIKPRDQLSSPFLFYVAMLDYKAHNFTTSFIVLSDLIQRGYEGVFSSYGLRMIFPMVYLDTIRKYAISEQTDPILVLSLIKQESAFDSTASSGVGASGLMQLMPVTANETEPGTTSADLSDVDTNIRVGTKYLKYLLTRYNGNIVYALAAYNAGPHALDRWIRDVPAGRGIQEFIESIPYRETRDYVGSIIRNYYWYSRKLTGEIPKSLNFFWNLYGPPEIPATFTAVSEEKD